MGVSYQIFIGPWFKYMYPHQYFKYGGTYVGLEKNGGGNSSPTSLGFLIHKKIKL
jgi:hypothetical protein